MRRISAKPTPWATTALAEDCVEPLQRRGGAGQLVVRQVEVAHGGRHVSVSEQALDGVDVDTGFQQVGGETVAPIPSSE